MDKYAMSIVAGLRLEKVMKEIILRKILVNNYVDHLLFYHRVYQQSGIIPYCIYLSMFTLYRK